MQRCKKTGPKPSESVPGESVPGESVPLRSRAAWDRIQAIDSGSVLGPPILCDGGADMRTKSILAGVAATIIGILLAQSDADYQNWMKTVAATNQSLQKNLAAKNAEGISADATKLQETFKQVEVFWQTRNSSDATSLAKQAQTVAASISKDAASGNMDQAAADAKNLAAACGACHMAHREKGDSGFKIK